MAESNDYIECPCCGETAAVPDDDGLYYYGQLVICGCIGLHIACDAETPPYVSGECEVDHGW